MANWLKTRIAERFGSLRQTKQPHHSLRRSLIVLSLLVFIALFKNFIANDPAKSPIPPLIPYSAQTQDAQNRLFVSPFDAQNTPSVYQRHWFGTDEIGRDVAAGVIAGTRSALFIGVGGMLLALAIGLPLGLIAGFYGDNRLRMLLLTLILRGCLFVILIFYAYVFLNLKNPAYWLFAKLFLIVVVSEIVFRFLEKNILSKVPYLNRQTTVPLDLMIMRLVEIMDGVPFLLWILGALTITQTLSLGSLILLIGLTQWLEFTKLIRGEVLRIRPLAFMEAAELTGASVSRLLFRHALPNVWTPALINFAFGISSAVLLEASLSFIGLGLPPEEVTWGTLLNTARGHLQAWWLIVFPGLAVFLTVYTFNKLGETLNEV
jgi:peptide/nickel transport system permease protein